MRLNGDFIRDKDYINKIVRETILPFFLQELHASPSGSPSNKNNHSFKDLVTNHLLPLLEGSAAKTKLEAHQEFLFDKTVEIIDELRDKCCRKLGFTCDSCQDESLPSLIEKKMLELKAEITMLRKDNKKSKKLEEKLTPENQKLKTDNATLKADVKKLKSDSQGSRNELKKLKDEVQKYKTENTKLKHEVKILNEALNDAGVDLRISSEFCGS
jgi:cell division protein FtsB